MQIESIHNGFIFVLELITVGVALDQCQKTLKEITLTYVVNGFFKILNFIIVGLAFLQFSYFVNNKTCIENT